MSRVILVIAAGNQPYFKATLPRLVELAGLAQADILIRRLAESTMQECCWIKLRELEALSRRYGRILTIDADVMPNFHALTRMDVNLLFMHSFAMAVDQGMKTMPERFWDWRKSMPSPEKFSSTAPYYNAGLMGLDAAYAYDLAAEANQRQVPPCRLQDQNFVNWYASLHPPTGVFPQVFNWMAPQFREATLAAKLIHFAGTEGKEFIPIYDEILPKTASSI